MYILRVPQLPGARFLILGSPPTAVYLVVMPGAAALPHGKDLRAVGGCHSTTLPLHSSVSGAGLSALSVRHGQMCGSNCTHPKQLGLTYTIKDGDCGSINQTVKDLYSGERLIKGTNGSIFRGQLICCANCETCSFRSPITATLLQLLNGHCMMRRIFLMTVRRFWLM